jgi:hypothetical protein
VAFGQLVRNRDVLTIDPTGLGKSLAESRDHGGARLGRATMQIADEREPLLRTGRERPCCNAADKRDEFPPPHGAHPKARITNYYSTVQRSKKRLPKSEMGQNENPPWATLCQLRPAADKTVC